MSQRSCQVLSAGVFVSLFLNLALLGFLLLERPAGPVHGQAVAQGDGFILATEQANDQSPICFLLDTRKPHLLVYKSDPAGLLQLTSSRDIKCDLLLPDNHMPRGMITGNARTQPPVSAVCKAVGESNPTVKKNAKKDKDEEKKEPGDEDSKGEEPKPEPKK